MTLSRLLTLALGLLLGLLLGLGLGRFWPAPDPVAQITCRPSHPALALQDDPRPVVLFWGNSLLFDHGWDSPDFAAINCAEQGLTAADARQITAKFPLLEPDIVVLAFGSVELMRPDPVDPATFARDINAIASMMRGRVIVTSLPTSGASPWDYAPHTNPEAMNAALRATFGAGVLDLNAAFATLPGPLHYDGIHLTPAAYGAWRRALEQRLTQQGY